MANMQSCKLFKELSQKSRSQPAFSFYSLRNFYVFLTKASEDQHEDAVNKCDSY